MATLPKIVLDGMLMTVETACLQINTFACSGDNCPPGCFNEGKIPLSKNTTISFSFFGATLTFCVVLPLVLIFFITWAPLASFPLVVFLVRTVWHAHGAHLNRCLAVAGLLQWTFGALFVVGMVL